VGRNHWVALIEYVIHISNGAHAGSVLSLARVAGGFGGMLLFLGLPPMNWDVNELNSCFSVRREAAFRFWRRDWELDWGRGELFNGWELDSTGQFRVSDGRGGLAEWLDRTR
jgi:hypothetical protein